MDRPALADLDDLAVLLDQDIENTDQASARLDQASDLVRAYAGTTWLDDDDNLLDVPGQIVRVTASIVDRASRNPDGAVSEQAGPFARSFGQDAAQRIYLSANDKLIIRDAVGRTSIGTLSTTRGPLETPSVAPIGVAEEVIWP